MVAVDGRAASPSGVARREILLSRDDVPATRQPYHDGFGTAQQDRRVIARLMALVQRAADVSVEALLADDAIAFSERPTIRAALVVGSVIDPETVANPHIRAHANEGRLFRIVLERALAKHGVACDVIVQKSIEDDARKRLRVSEKEVQRTLGEFGAALGRPWRGDEKRASLAAWMALA